MVYSSTVPFFTSAAPSPFGCTGFPKVAYSSRLGTPSPSKSSISPVGAPPGAPLNQDCRQTSLDVEGSPVTATSKGFSLGSLLPKCNVAETGKSPGRYWMDEMCEAPGASVAGSGEV